MAPQEQTMERCGGRCKARTWHTIVGQAAWGRGKGWTDDWHSDHYYLIRCDGCEHVHVKRVESDVGFPRDERGEPIDKVHYYPSQSTRELPDWLEHVDARISPTIVGFLQEIYAALENDMTRLGASGVRALLEAVMIDKIGDNGNFNENLTAMVAEGWLTPRSRQQVEAVLEVGHGAMHRRHVPSKDGLLGIIDVAESIVKSMYADAAIAKKAAKSVPPRRKRQNAKRRPAKP